MAESKPLVKLVGENGNAYVIIAACIKAAKQAGWPKEKVDQVRQEMMSGDYHNLLQTAMKYFDVE